MGHSLLIYWILAGIAHFCLPPTVLSLPQFVVSLLLGGIMLPVSFLLRNTR